MSKRKKRRTRAAEEDADPSQSPPEAIESAPTPVADAPRRNLPALLIAGSLWAGWFIYLVYVAATRK